METIPVINGTPELKDCRDKWFFDKQYGCCCLEDVLYTEKADIPKFQRLSVFVPKQYLNADGTPSPESRNVPVVFENNAAGYMQMPHTWLGGPRNYAEQYLNHGLIYITCGCRGRESHNAQGEAVGKAPATLVDLKTAIRFLRHNREALPGDFNRIISVGWSAGGAMSALLGITGDHPDYDPYLKAAGAFMDESDAVFAAQIYCPIIDLEHADMAYEWCFGADKTSEDSPAGPGEIMTPFKEALSRKLAEKYIAYINSLKLTDPGNGNPLTLTGLRSGSFHDYQMACLNESASVFFSRLESGKEPVDFSADDYLRGNYTREVPVHGGPAAHHAGPGVGLHDGGRPMSLGDMMSRPPAGVPFEEKKPQTEIHQGKDKRHWLSWYGHQARIADLDTYVLNHRRRMKSCPSFDTLANSSGENHVFGTGEKDYMHFSASVREALEELRNQFPEETDEYAAAYREADDAGLRERVRLINPMAFIGCNPDGHPAQYYRIRTGACDADTSFSVSMTLALRLANEGYPVDYALVWDQPHSEADYPGEILAWIDSFSSN